jgi:hypothetical protein
MKKPSTYIIIALVLIIIFFCFIYFFGKGKFEKEIKDNNNYISKLNQQIKELKNKPSITIKEFVKLADKDKEKVYLDLKNNYESSLVLLDQAKEKLQNINKQLEQCNNTLKRKNKVSITPIFALGTDQELNFNSQIGIVVNGYVYNGLLIDVSIGGGASYSNRTDFNKTIHGANILFDISINF